MNGDIGNRIREDISLSNLEEICMYSPHHPLSSGDVAYARCQTCKDKDFKSCNLFQKLQKEISNFEEYTRK